MDEDTGEVVSIERNEVVLDRETILEKEHLELIQDSGAKPLFCTKKTSTSRIMPSYTTRFKRIAPTRRRRLLNTFTVNFETPSHQIWTQRAV